MTISDRIFERLKKTNMSQKAFSECTGISQSTISEWKSKRTNPTSEKILVICEVVKCLELHRSGCCPVLIIPVQGAMNFHGS